MVEFGEQLRRAREAKGMTQQSLAEQLYVTRQSVSRWECGDRYPDLLTTKKISQILEVSLDDLLSGKEMTKVVERNPVIENKLANNIMIVLYAFVVLSYLITVFDIAIRLTMVPQDSMEPSLSYLLVIQITGLALSIAAFSYGLVNAVRGTLSPKRMGAVLVAYFVACIVTDTNLYMPSEAWEFFAFAGISIVLPNIIGGIGSFFYFIKADKRKIWICLITLVSIWGIYRALFSLYPLILGAGEMFALNLSSRIVLSIAIDVLILYQTYTLYKKRLSAIEVTNS
jgi:transcriptional regulator with XRE-family HTH domain